MMMTAPMPICMESSYPASDDLQYTSKACPRQCREFASANGTSAQLYAAWRQPAVGYDAWVLWR